MALDKFLKESDIPSLPGGGGGNAINIGFNSVLTFDNDKYMAVEQSADIAFSISGDDHVLGKVISCKIVGDGENEITFAEIFKILSGAIDNTKTNYLYFNFVSETEIRTTISFEGGSGGQVDLTGDINVDEFGVGRLGENPDSVGEWQIPFRNDENKIVGNAGLKFDPSKGFDVIADFSTPVATEVHIVNHVLKSKIRFDSSYNNSNSARAWSFEADLRATGDVQVLEGFVIDNKIKDNGKVDVRKRFIYVTNTNDDAVIRTKFNVYEIGANLFMELGNLFKFSNGIIEAQDGVLIKGGGFNYVNANYQGVRFALPVTVGSNNAPTTGAQFEIQNNDHSKPAASINSGYLRQYQKATTVSAAITPTKVFEMSIGLLEGYIFEITLVCSSSFYPGGIRSYFLFTSGANNDVDGLLTFIGADKNIILEENDEVTWLVTTALNQATKKFEVYFSKNTIGDVAVIANVKVNRM